MNIAAKKFFYRHINATLLTLVLVAFCIALGMYSEYFFTLKNIKNLFESNSYRLILATGMSIVVASGAIDLSAGAVLSLSGIVMAMACQSGASVALSILLGILAGAGMGGANGLVIAKTKINPLIVTLAAMSIYRGLALILTKGSPITKFPASFLYWGRSDVEKLNPPLVMAILLFAIAIPLMYRTKFGIYITGLGGNLEALRRQGVNTSACRISAHVLMGVYAAVVGLIVTARLNTAEANAGLNMEIDAITAAIMGGTPLSGGKISLYGTFISILLLGVIRNGLTILAVNSYYQQFIVGGLLLVSVTLAKLRQREK